LTWISDESRFPAIATDLNSNIHVVWNAHKSGNEEIYYKRSTDGGTSWGAAQRLTWTSNDSWFPALAIDSNDHIHIVFREEYTPGNPELYYKRSTNGGTSWSAAQRLTWTSDSSLLPAIATNLSSNIHLVWHDYTPGNSEIYYKKSTHGGTTWGAAQRLTWTPDTSELPAVTVDSNNFIHLVYKDYTPGNSEIYYKKGN
jgi:hypothetical protein